MREMKDSGIAWIGKIPVDWKVCRVKFLADNNHLYPIGDGDHGMIKSSDYLDEGIPYIRVLNLTWCNGLNLDNLVFISEEMNRRIKNSELKPNDILVAKTGATIGKTAIVPISLPISNTTSHVGKISIAPIHSAKYFYYVMSSFIVQKQIRDISAMQSTRPELGIEGLKNLILIVPSYKEQKQISYFLDAKCAEIDALSGSIQSEIDTLEQYKRSVISEAVTRGLDPNVPMKDSGIAWVGKIPASWTCVRGKFILKYLQKPVRSNDGVITCFRDGEVTLRSNRREEGFTMSDKEIGYQGVDKGDLVVHGMDGFAGAIGISDSRGKASPVLNVLDTQQNKKYIMYYLRSMAYGNVFTALATGIRVRSCDLRWNKLAELYYPIPSQKEQNAIVEFIDSALHGADAVIAQKQEQLDTLADYKKSLIYEYVTGKKEVPGL